jgi:hemoglobin-like flavoprotein
MSAQKEKLMHAISAVVHSIDRIDNIRPLLENLGQRHAEYGVVESHYNDVGSALIQTLKAGLGDEWTQPVHKAWLAAYTIVSSAMLGK